MLQQATAGVLSRVRILLLCCAMAAVACIRLQWARPAVFFEGDDAALCAGIARQCENRDIGPYFVHPPRVSAQRQEAHLAVLLPERSPSARFYRYDSMPGMYLLGRLTRPLGEVATRMFWVCFLAGTLAPLLWVLFFRRLLALTDGFSLVAGYALVALAPEPWVSGSVYINDKIVASSLFAASLLLVTPAARADGGRPVHGRLRALLGGLLFGGAVLARFDTVLFVPAAVVAIWLACRSERWTVAAACAALFCLSAAACSLAVMRAMDASLRLALASGAGAAHVLVLAGKLPYFFSALGPGQLVACLCFLPAWYLRGLIGAWLAGGIAGVWPWVLRAALIGLLTVPEWTLQLALPFCSQKYLLFSAFTVAALGFLVPLKLRADVGGARLGRRVAAILSLSLLGLPVALPAAGAVVGFGLMGGADGLRGIGGHLRLPLQEHRDSRLARQVVAFLDRQSATMQADVIVPRPSWMCEEALAYHCVVRGWSNSLAVTQVGSPYRVALNAYAHPERPGLRVLVPSDGDAGMNRTLITYAALASGARRPVYFLLTASVAGRPGSAGQTALLVPASDGRPGPCTLEITATGERNPRAVQGGVALLEAEAWDDAALVDRLSGDSGWRREGFWCYPASWRGGDTGPGVLRWSGPTLGWVALKFARHPSAGIVQVRWNGREAVSVDLYSDTIDEYTLVLPATPDVPCVVVP